MNKKLTILLLGTILLQMVSCNKVPKEVTIVFTNDVHSHIANDEDKLRFSNVGAYVDDLKYQGKNTLLFDAGDSIQGSVYGGFDNGTSIIEIMNETNYDLSVPGNHEFDYNISTFLNLAKNVADFPYLSCNFVSLSDNKTIFDSTKIFTFKNLKIGVVGISTPETLTSSTPTFFQNENSEWIYDFIGSSDCNLLYSTTQDAVDSIRNKVDYVVAVGHLGINKSTIDAGLSSINVINNTNGIDIFIDGHSHNVVTGELIKNKDNKDVVLAQAGQYLEQFGVITINNDKTISVKMETGYPSSKTSIKEKEDKLINEVDRLMGNQVAVSNTEFFINNPDNPNQRLIRTKEMNAGDLVADSFYWYLNDYKELNCDFAFHNGGGVRANIAQGPVTNKNLKDVVPFNNVLCLIEATGQQIKDAIELGVNAVGKWDEENQIPSENGGFLHVAGLRYTVDCNIESHVEIDDKGMFVNVNGDYRTTNIQIYDKTLKTYVNLDLSKTYRIGGVDYILRNSGNGLNMFTDNKSIADHLETDFQALSFYISNFTKSGEYPVINTSNSPLTKYINYDLNYENPYGSNRITILNSSF